MGFHITLIYTAILGLIFVALSVRVVRHRIKNSVSLGSGGNHPLNIAIRTHGNFSEYIPIALLLVMGVESLQFPAAIVHAFGIILVLARLSHAYGLATKSGLGRGRPLGVIATVSVITISSVMILVKLF